VTGRREDEEEIDREREQCLQITAPTLHKKRNGAQTIF
jgi:hypothetical protein